MIGDLYKGFNEGDSNTVRIVMQIGEARRLLGEILTLQEDAGDRSKSGGVQDLISILEYTIEREDRVR